MSAFLGPIHHWLYNKIQIQQSIVDGIIKIGETEIPDLKEELNTQFGITETRPLEEVIDTDNIHGWLQTNVTQAERKLAHSIASLLKKNPEYYKAIETVFEEKGREFKISTENAVQIYKGISDSLLDGMPCDHANTVLEESVQEVIWKRNNCVHKDYWEEAGGDINMYYSLREAFIRGFLSESNFVFEKIDEITNRIKRRDDNE